MEKTVRQWIEELPDGYRERALKNMEECGWCTDNKNLHYMNNAIDMAFNWCSSPEGNDFWTRVYDHYRVDSPLPKLPEN